MTSAINKEIFGAGTLRENEGTLSGKGASVPAFDVVRPQFNYIQTQAMTAGIGRLKQQINYASTVAEISREEQKYEIEKNRLRSNKEIKEKLDILGQQESFFSAVASHNMIAEFQDGALQYQRDYIQNNPTRDGLFDGTVEACDDLAKSILSRQMTPEQRQLVSGHLLQNGIHSASNSLKLEIQGKEATAVLELEKAGQEAVSFIARGGDPGDAVERLQPIADAIPNTLVNKAETFEKIKSGVVLYSLEQQAISNPDLAEYNLQNGKLYQTLNGRERIHIQRIIEGKRSSLRHEASIIQLEQLTEALADGNSSERKILEGVMSSDQQRSISYEELASIKGGLNPKFYQYCLRMLANKNDYELENRVIRSSDEYWKGMVGDYRNTIPERQKIIWTEDLLTKQAKDKRGNLIFEGGRARLEGEMGIDYKVDKAMDFTTNLVALQQDIIKSVMDGTEAEANDAIMGYSKLLSSNRITLGEEGSTFNKEMKTALSITSGLGGIAAVRQAIFNMRAPITEEEAKILKTRYEIPENKFSEASFKELLDVYDEKNPHQKLYAEMTYKQEFQRTKGQKDLAYRNTALSFLAGMKRSRINGSGVETVGFGYPESWIKRDIRKEINSAALSKISEVMKTADGILLNGEVTIETDEKMINEPDTNKVIIKGKYGLESIGHIIYTPTSPKGRKYEVRYVEDSRMNREELLKIPELSLAQGIGGGETLIERIARFTPEERKEWERKTQETEYVSKYGYPKDYKMKRMGLESVYGGSGFNTHFNEGIPIIGLDRRPITIDLDKDIYIESENVIESRKDIRNMAVPTNEKQVIDVDMGIGQRSPESVKNLFKYMHKAR
jgi:hypothetical protein